MAALRISAALTATLALVLAFCGSTFAATLAISPLVWAVATPRNGLLDVLALTRFGGDERWRYGRVRLWTSAGWAASGLACGALFARSGFGPAPVLFACGVVVLAIATSGTPDVAAPPRALSDLRGVGRVFRAAPGFPLLLLALLCAGTAQTGASAFVGLTIVDLGGGVFMVGVAAALTAIVEIPLMWYGGSLARKVGPGVVCVTGLAVQACVYAIWMTSPTAGLIVSAAALNGSGFALLHIASVLLVAKFVPERQLASGQIMAQTAAWSIGPIIGTLMGGLLFGAWGRSALFAVTFALSGGAIAFVFLALRRHAVPSRSRG